MAGGARDALPKVHHEFCCSEFSRFPLRAITATAMAQKRMDFGWDGGFMGLGWAGLITGGGFIIQSLSGVALAIGNGAPNRRSIVSVSRRYTDT